MKNYKDFLNHLVVIHLEIMTCIVCILIVKHLKTFADKNVKFIGDHFSGEKNIDVIAVPKQMGQSQNVSNIINNLLQIV